MAKKQKDEVGWLSRVLRENEEETKDWPKWKLEEGRREWNRWNDKSDESFFAIKPASNKKKVVSISERELTRLICSFPIPYGGIAEIDGCPEEYCELSHFTGNQYDDSWGWYYDNVESMPLKGKLKLLEYLRSLEKDGKI